MDMTFIQQGGLIMQVLIAAYFLSLGITFERVFYFFWAHSRSAVFVSKLEAGLQQGLSLRDSLDRVGAKATNPYVQLCEAFITHQAVPKVQRDDLMFAVSARLLKRYSSSVWLLHLIGTLAPMLGLMGTMTGLIKSFKGIESLKGNVDISVLAGGIWEAMLTTVAGLIVGILSLLTYRILDHYVDRRAQYMEELVALLNGYHA